MSVAFASAGCIYAFKRNDRRAGQSRQGVRRNTAQLWLHAGGRIIAGSKFQAKLLQTGKAFLRKTKSGIMENT